MVINHHLVLLYEMNNWIGDRTGGVRVPGEIKFVRDSQYAPLRRQSKTHSQQAGRRHGSTSGRANKI